MRLRVALLGLLGAAMVAGTGCAEQIMNGFTADQIFTDAGAARLSQAACKGDARAIERALRDGAQANTKGQFGITPLVVAVHCKSSNGVIKLIMAGGDPTYYIDGVYPIIYFAAAKSSPEIIRILIEAGADPNASKSDSNRSALMEAMSRGIDDGDWSAYEALLDCGADINKDYGAGKTIAIFAANQGQLDKLESLIDRGYRYQLDNLIGHIEVRAYREDLELKGRDIIARLKGLGGHSRAPPD